MLRHGGIHRHIVPLPFITRALSSPILEQPGRQDRSIALHINGDDLRLNDTPGNRLRV